MALYAAPTNVPFDFTQLWDITQRIWESSPGDARLWPLNPNRTLDPGFRDRLALAPEACNILTGGHDSWTPYAISNILTRLTSWKMPLLQLVAQFSRPPLSIAVEIFVIIHLMGDPIDTIWSLLHKISICQDRAIYWRKRYRQEKDWKAFALIQVSYDEWKPDDLEADELRRGLYKRAVHRNFNPKKEDDRPPYLKVAGRLAADRSTKFLPMSIAQIIFVMSLEFAFQRTAAAANDFSDPINVEVHNIAFSALYFWVIPATFLSAIVGASQSELAIPDALRQLQENFGAQSRHTLSPMLRDQYRRVVKGGIYSWQLDKWHSSSRSALLFTMAFAFVVLGLAAAVWVSALTPPDGIDCRHVAQGLICLFWALSCLADFLIQMLVHGKNQFRATFIKDALFASITVIGIILTHVGLLNRCSCWTQFGRVGIPLPQQPATAAILGRRIWTWYPGIIFGSSLLQIVLFVFVACWYRLAFKVLLQRDDGKSNIAFLLHLHPRRWRLCRWTAGWKRDQRGKETGHEMRLTTSRDPLLHPVRGNPVEVIVNHPHVS